MGLWTPAAHTDTQVVLNGAKYTLAKSKVLSALRPRGDILKISPASSDFSGSARYDNYRSRHSESQEREKKLPRHVNLVGRGPKEVFIHSHRQNKALVTAPSEKGKA